MSLEDSDQENFTASAEERISSNTVRTKPFFSLPVFQVSPPAAVLILSLLSLLLLLWPTGQIEDLSWIGAISLELRNVLLAASAAALGASVETLFALARTIKHRKFAKSGQVMFLLRVLVAVPMAIVFYFVIRGGLLTPEANVAVINQYSITAISFLVGMYSEPMLNKLNQIAQTLFVQESQESQVESQLDRIGAALGVTTLDNYQGFVCLFLRDNQGEVVNTADDGTPVLRPERPYELVVWFQPNKPEVGTAEEIRITEGIDSRDVDFYVVPDGDSITFRPQRELVSFETAKPSPRVTFQFRSPASADPYELWVEVSQKNRFIRDISTTFYVEQEEG
jgi:hypothetical protein